MERNVNTIFMTSDYDKFDLLDANRTVDINHVTRLKESIEQSGYIAANPIVVNRDGKIIDGQHRFTACRELRLPIYYVVTDADDDTLITLNVTQKTWNLRDYAAYYIKKGLIAYSKLMDFVHRNNIAQVGVALAFVRTEGVYCSATMKDFKAGLLDITDNDIERAEQLYTASVRLFSLLGLPFQRKSYGAVIKMANNPNFSMDRLVKKAEMFRDRAYPTSNVLGTMRMLEGLYNHHETAARRIHFA